MGNAEVKERFERAEKTKILTASGLDLSNWDKLHERLSTLNQLRTMTLSENKFEKRIPRAFVSSRWFASLKVLDLQKNLISDISQLSSWGTILVDGEGGSAKPEKEAAALIAAADIEASLAVAETLASKNSDAIAQYPLETLLLNDNKISSVPPLLFHRFPRLKKLDLSRNQIKVLGPQHFLFATELVEIALESNKIEHFMLDGVGTASAGILNNVLQKLQVLHLSQNRITRFGLPYSHLAALRSIDLANQQSGAHLESVDTSVFTAAPQLNDIVIKGSPRLKAIVETWKAADVYRKWELVHAAVVDKQIAGGAEAKLMH